MSLIIAKYPSKLFLPDMDKPYPFIVDFLKVRFPQISEQRWIDRINRGLVCLANGKKLTKESLYTPLTMLLYYKTADEEISIPFKEKIIYMDKNVIAVDKPHFLPVMPGGKYINENLLTRLKEKTGNHDIVPVHRIDRETSGVVLFSSDRRTRGAYQSLFMNGKVEKTYYAITEPSMGLADSSLTVLPWNLSTTNQSYLIQSRIVKGEPWFTMKQVKGKINARTIITEVKRKNYRVLFKIRLLTGKKHQIRIHLSSIGCKIVNDSLYPHLLPEHVPDFQNPLKLQSKRVKFSDPVTGRIFEFISTSRMSFYKK